MLKKKLFTHIDMDGVGPDILLKSVFGSDNVNTEFCNYNTINEYILKFLSGSDLNDYDTIYITDISVNSEVAELLNKHNESWLSELLFNESLSVKGLKVYLLDHHTTAMWLNKYSWATVTELDELGNKTSGTELVYKHIRSEHSDLLKYVHLDLAQLTYDINMYDSWRWFNDYEEPYIAAKELNDLFQLIGRYRFSIEMLSGKYIEDFRLLIDTERKRVERILVGKRKELKRSVLVDKNGIERPFGYVFAEANSSEIGNEFCRENLDLHFVAVMNIGTKKVSLRSVLPEEDLHLGTDIASLYNGGGHGPSAGCDLTGVFKDLVLEHLASSI